MGQESKTYAELVVELRAAYSKAMSVGSSIRRIAWLDVPDHHNIGDSAILVGQLDWASEMNLATSAFVPRVGGRASFRRLRGRRDLLPILQGGGFFGGLYPAHDLFRRSAVSRLPRLLQAPQSVEFVSSLEEDAYGQLFELHPHLLLARDRWSAATLQSLGANVRLAPDGAHWITSTGPLPKPARSAVYLLRNDQEAAESRARASIMAKVHKIDWPDEESLFVRRARQLSLTIDSLSGVMPYGRSRYETAVRARLLRGFKILAQGESIVTDRLHAMILGVHMGRRVVAIDNGNGKLRKYYETWLSRLGDDELTFYGDFADALDAGVFR